MLPKRIGGESCNHPGSLGIMLIAENRSPFLFHGNPTCEAHQFLYGDAFFTNISIFEYSIIFIDRPGRFLYSAVPLDAMCYFFDYTVKVDRAQRTVLSNVGLIPLWGDKYETHKYRVKQGHACVSGK